GRDDPWDVGSRCLSLRWRLLLCGGLTQDESRSKETTHHREHCLPFHSSSNPRIARMTQMAHRHFGRQLRQFREHSSPERYFTAVYRIDPVSGRPSWPKAWPPVSREDRRCFCERLVSSDNRRP